MKKNILLILLLILSLSFLSCTFMNEYETGIDVANKNLPSVVELTCEFQASISYATGFIISEHGHVLTNAHVITESLENFIYEAIKIKATFYNSNAEYSLKIIDYDISKDLAILKFEREHLTLKPVQVGNSENLAYGATIFALGNAEGNRISMTKGIISVPRINYRDTETDEVNEFIQIDAAVNNGSSGGPVMNTKGNVIGIISFKLKRPGTFVDGIGFAIPSSVFMKFVQTSLNGITQEPLNESSFAQ